MSKFTFVSHESFPADEYTKEIVYLEIAVPARVAFVRKSAKNGGMFWSIPTVGVSKNGEKDYFPAYVQDSNFLEKDIKEFLDKRLWERGSVEQSAFSPSKAKYGHEEAKNENELPF